MRVAHEWIKAMAEQYLNERVVVAKEVCHGKPRIAGTRILVHTILDLLAAGKRIDEITSADYYPDISPADVLACVAYSGQFIQQENIVPVS